MNHRIERYKHHRKLYENDNKLKEFIELNILNKIYEYFSLKISITSIKDNFLFKQFDFRKIAENLIICGNHFLLKTKSDGKLIGISDLPIESTYVVVNQKGELSGYHISESGKNYDNIEDNMLEKDEIVNIASILFPRKEENVMFGNCLFELPIENWSSKIRPISNIMFESIVKIINEWNLLKAIGKDQSNKYMIW